MQYHTGTTLQATVPTDAIRRGDFSKESYTVRDPFNNNTPFPEQPDSDLADQLRSRPTS